MYCFLKGFSAHNAGSIAHVTFQMNSFDPVYSSILYLIFILLFFYFAFLQCLLLDFHTHSYSLEHLLNFRNVLFFSHSKIDQFSLLFLLDFCSFLFLVFQNFVVFFISKYSLEVNSIWSIALQFSNLSLFLVCYHCFMGRMFISWNVVIWIFRFLPTLVFMELGGSPSLVLVEKVLSWSMSPVKKAKYIFKKWMMA